jgi:hypothetical protein
VPCPVPCPCPAAGIGDESSCRSEGTLPAPISAATATSPARRVPTFLLASPNAVSAWTAPVVYPREMQVTRDSYRTRSLPRGLVSR